MSISLPYDARTHARTRTHSSSTDALNNRCSLPWPLTAGCQNLTHLSLGGKKWLCQMLVRYHLGWMDNLKNHAFNHSWVYVSTRGQKKKGNRRSSHCLSAAGIMGSGDTSCLYYDDILNCITMCFNQKHLTQQPLWERLPVAATDSKYFLFSPQEDRLKWILIYNRQERNSKADGGEKTAVFINEFLQLMMERNFKADE